MPKKYIVRLSEEEQDSLWTLVNCGKAAAHKRRHAQILLKADVNGDNWTDARICEAFNVGQCTVERVRQRLVEQGLEAAINRAKATRTRRRALDGEQEAQLVTLACSQPPNGRTRWTLTLLADKLVELTTLESISPETVRQVLKKHHQTVATSRMVHPA